MIFLLLVPLIIAWAIIQANIVETTGNAPRSRPSLRYQRRKARKMGVDAEDVAIFPRLTPLAGDYQDAKARIAKWNPYLWGAVIVIWAVILAPWHWITG
jgi:hypothetical protein